jgi:hypothetical protein
VSHLRRNVLFVGRALPRFVAVCGLLASAAAPLHAAFRCDSNTALTPIGVDTQAQHVLFALPPRSGAAGPERWVLDVDLARGVARASLPVTGESGEAPFAGSTGPGPVLAAVRCGAKCLQVVRFRDGAWHRLGEPLLASDASTVHLTWDRAGAAWAVLHAIDKSGGVAATAYRLDGADWASKGAALVRAVGNPGAAPAPAGEQGITSGDVVFASAGKPRRFVSALPKLVGAASGQLVWLGGGSAVHLGSDGLLRTTADGGTSWQAVHWQPMTPGQGALAFRPGVDYWIELPDGERTAPLAAVWNDRRSAEGQLFFAVQDAAAGPWRVEVTTPQGILTKAGERLPYNHVFRFAGDRWALVTGCVARQDGADLAIRRVADGKLGPPELLRISSP